MVKAMREAMTRQKKIEIEAWPASSIVSLPAAKDVAIPIMKKVMAAREKNSMKSFLNSNVITIAFVTV
jgi:hypothetical protein